MRRSTSGDCVLRTLRVPVVQAPMAGGPSTPALAAAVNRGGGLGFLAAGYLPAADLAASITVLRTLTDRPFGVNVFAHEGTPADVGELAAYVTRLAPLAARAGVELGEPSFDDDALDAKIDLLTREPVDVVSFTFGVPSREAIEALRAAGSEVWLTVTSPAEALIAAELSPDALIVQGIEAGGHRGVFVDDDDQPTLGLLPALALIRDRVDLPLVAAGGIMTGATLAAVLVAGAAAGQCGSAFLGATEAGTPDVHRDAALEDLPTVVTRAFSGRSARGIVNAWHAAYGRDAPRAYPEVHHLTSPVRGRGRAQGDRDLVSLWAGQAHRLARRRSATDITADLGRDALDAVSAAAAAVQALESPAQRARPASRPRDRTDGSGA